MVPENIVTINVFMCDTAIYLNITILSKYEIEKKLKRQIQWLNESDQPFFFCDRQIQELNAA